MPMDELDMTCPFNDGVDCRERYVCDKCGWNPVVDSARKKMLHETGRVVTDYRRRWSKMIDEDIAAEFRRRMRMFEGTEGRYLVQAEMHIGSRRAAGIIKRMKDGEL